MGYRKLGTLAVCAAVFGVACGSSRTIDDHDDRDAAIIVNLDGAMLDAGVDAGPPSNVGAACTSDADCFGLADLCIQGSELMPGGYCTRACTRASGCPAGSVCMNFGRNMQYCMQECDAFAETSTCRTGYGCADDPALPSAICLGGCDEASDCPEGLLCDPTGGDVGEGSCYDPNAEWGAPCENDSQCPLGALCYSEELAGWPSGACIAYGCDSVANTGCPEGHTCIESTSGVGLCLPTCDPEGDECRPGYTCAPTRVHPDRPVCRPGCERAEDGSSPTCTGDRVCNPGLGTCAVPFPDGQLGVTCSWWSGGCEGGTCFTEYETGYPGAYCVYEGCTVGDDSTCPEGGVCVPSAESSRGVCHRACDVESPDCRDGYRCRDVDLDGPLTATACMPACTSSAQCANAGSTCSPVSGLCSTF